MEYRLVTLIDPPRARIYKSKVEVSVSNSVYEINVGKSFKNLNNYIKLCITLNILTLNSDLLV